MRVFNASPLILLLEEIDEPDIIKRLSEIDKELLIPERIIREIISPKAKKSLESLIKEEVIKPCDNGDNETFSFLKNRFPMLDDGELTVISIVYKNKNCFAIIDEYLGREVTKRLELNLKGVFGILLELYKSKKITKERLTKTCRKIDKSNFRINFKEIRYEWVIK